ncbi:MAG: alpha/beta hydrolase [Myxococcaceae bacterium]|nr:alpha/beta hydrolase [Myxococcaceae bacterium]MBH2006377.1 alpha/beta hydrolase [Myxococcaceae bacterium]
MSQNRNLEIHSKIDTPDGTGLFARLIRMPSAKNHIPIILNDGLGCNGFIWKHFIEYFKAQHPIIHWHYRGHGHSDTPEQIQNIGMEHAGRDLELILDHFGYDEAILCGHSMGVQVALEAYRNRPDRYPRLILMCGSYEYPLLHWHNSPIRHRRPTWLNQMISAGFPRIFPLIQKYHFVWQSLWSLLLSTDLPYQIAMYFEVNRKRIEKEDFLPYFKHLSSMPIEVFVQMLKSYSEHSARAVLEQIDKPTLIISGGQDTFCPHWILEDLHRTVENSELLYIPDGTHCAPIEHPELIHLRTEKFLRPLHSRRSDSTIDAYTAIR